MKNKLKSLKYCDINIQNVQMSKFTKLLVRQSFAFKSHRCLLSSCFVLGHMPAAMMQYKLFPWIKIQYPLAFFHSVELISLEPIFFPLSLLPLLLYKSLPIISYLYAYRLPG